MIFTVPIRLESEANGSHGHWSAKSLRVKEQRQAVTAASIDAGLHTTAHVIATAKKSRVVCRWKEPPVFPLVVTITRVAPRQLDDDNLARSGKAVRDQVAELLGVDDRDPRVTWRYAQERAGAREHACRIAIEAST